MHRSGVLLAHVSTEWHCGQWEIFFGLPSGPLLTVLNEHMWQHMD